MKGEIFDDQLPILTRDLSLAQSSKEDAIKERTLDTYETGVISGSQTNSETIEFKITDSSSLGVPKITVETGTAWSPLGERIIIPTPISTYDAALPSTLTPNGHGADTTLTPISTGSQDIPLTPSSTLYIWLGYLRTTDPTVYSFARIPNDKKLFTEATDGYLFGTSTNINQWPGFPTANTIWVLIGKVVTSVTGVTSIDMTGVNRQYGGLLSGNVRINIPASTAERPATYALGDETVLTDHINSIGDGTIGPTNPHAISFPNVSGSIADSQIPVGEIDGTKITDGTLTDLQISPASLTFASFADSSVISQNIALADGASSQDPTTGTGIKTSHIQDSAVTLAKLESALQGLFPQTGDFKIVAYDVAADPIPGSTGDTATPGWLVCTPGRAVSRITFANLFTKLGNGAIWGVGDGVLTFNLPDPAGCTIRGTNGISADAFSDPDALTRVARYAGGATGNNLGSYQLNEYKSHTHTYTGDLGSNNTDAGAGIPNPTSGTTSATGGNETRMNNMYVTVLIKV